LRIESETGPSSVIDLPAIDRGAEADHTVTVPVDFDAVSGRRFRISLEVVDPLLTPDWYSNAPLPLPVAIAEIGLPDVTLGPAPAEVDDRCRDELLTVADGPVGVRIVGTTADAVARLPLAIETCGRGPEQDLVLDTGESILQATPGNRTGIDLDAIELFSTAGGEAGNGHQPNDPGPDVTVTSEGFVDADVVVTGVAEPAWLLLGQSYNPGWTASADGDDLGQPTLVNGFANAWMVEPAEGGGDIAVALEWAPQRAVWLAMAVSGLGILVCLVLLVVDPRRRRTVVAEASAAAVGPGVTPTWRSPLTAIEQPATARVTAVAGLVALVLTAAFSGPAWGLLAGMGAVAALRWRWGLPVVRLGAVLGLAGAGAYITLSQLIRRYPPDFDWPNRFEATNWPALLGVSLLVIATLVDFGARRRVAGAPVAPDEERDEPSGS